MAELLSIDPEYPFLSSLSQGLLLNPLPSLDARSDTVPHAPKRNVPLSQSERLLAVNNALRYFPKKLHSILLPEFNEELEKFGHIYMYRFRPKFPIRAYPIKSYPGKTLEGRAIMLMVFNNLDPAVAQYPEELVTYGGNGQVLSNWAQFWILMKYLHDMDNNQTLSMCSGHPLGLFPSSPDAPRVVITNGLMVPNYSSSLEYDKYFALCVTMYGQMTAGSYCYIGPQGIVHGTTITLLNAARKLLKVDSMVGKVFVTSGLGGMSGAQAKAAVIAGCIGVIAEVNIGALHKRQNQGWLLEIIDDLDTLLTRIREAVKNKHTTSIGYHGNIVNLWERLALEYECTKELLPDLGTDQTSLHIPYSGGYYPVGLTFEESQNMMVNDPAQFKQKVQESLRRQVRAIRKLTNAGMYFWDYGNAFLLEAMRAGAEILDPEIPEKFIYPSYVEAIMGDIFSLGFGPFRWICTSGDSGDLEKTDQAAIEIFNELLQDKGLPKEVVEQYQANLKWIREASLHKMVVGSEARILYSDYVGRIRLAKRFNELIKSGDLKGPIVISRDHHDVSGADSPFRETANITDGSKFTSDMSIQNFIGDGIRGASWVALHNGGGVGWGEVINGGFGLVLNGSNSETAERVLEWDVNNGVARRAWAGNKYAQIAMDRAMKINPKIQVTMANF